MIRNNRPQGFVRIESATIALLTLGSITVGVFAMPGERLEQTAGPKSVWDGVYAEDQGKRGEALSQSSCVACHGEQLSGTDLAPALQGQDFRAAWDGRTAGDLFEKIRTTMPADAVGSLNPRQTADLVAYIFKLNDFPAGQTELASEPASLSEVRIRSQK